MELMGTSNDFVRASVKDVTDEQMGEIVETFAGPLPKETICWFLRDHMTHTRGQLVVYLRLNGIVPPQYGGL